jgi:hypothetical protein
MRMDDVGEFEKGVARRFVNEGGMRLGKYYLKLKGVPAWEIVMWIARGCP